MSDKEAGCGEEYTNDLCDAKWPLGCAHFQYLPREQPIVNDHWLQGRHLGEHRSRGNGQLGDSDCVRMTTGVIGWREWVKEGGRAGRDNPPFAGEGWATRFCGARIPHCETSLVAIAESAELGARTNYVFPH